MRNDQMQKAQGLELLVGFSASRMAPVILSWIVRRLMTDYPASVQIWICTSPSCKRLE
jgi:hypothetical protein